jgi:hypothetical protein
MRPRRIAPVGPRLRQRDLPADSPGAHEYPAGAAALDEQNLQTPPVQWMERMGDNGETQIVTARSVTMPPPWEYPADVACATPVWGSSVP